MSTGQGASSAQQAVGQQHSHDAQRVATVGSFDVSRLDDLCVGQDLPGMTAEEISAAVERAAGAVKGAYHRAVYCVNHGAWEEAARHADYAHAYLQQLIALSRIQRRSQA